MRHTNWLVTLSGIVVILFSAISFAADDAVTTTTTTTSADGSTTVVKKTIITPAPKSISCTTVAAHWEDNVWIDEQTMCKYAGRTEGAEWVNPYWACTAFTDAGDCTTWEYRQGYWVKSAQ